MRLLVFKIFSLMSLLATLPQSSYASLSCSRTLGANYLTKGDIYNLIRTDPKLEEFKPLLDRQPPRYDRRFYENHLTESDFANIEDAVAGLFEINETARGLWNLDPEFEINMNYHLSTFLKMPTHKGISFRGADILDSRSLRKHLTVGAIVSDKGFMSTSLSIAIAKTFMTPNQYEQILELGSIEGDEDIKSYATLLVIKGTSGIPIEAISVLPEEEVIFTPGTQFRVVQVKINSDYSHTIFLEEAD